MIKNMEYSYDGGMGVGSAVEWMVGRACSIGSCVSNASGEGCERRDKKKWIRRWEEKMGNNSEGVCATSRDRKRKRLKDGDGYVMGRSSPS